MFDIFVGDSLRKVVFAERVIKICRMQEEQWMRGTVDKKVYKGTG